MTACPTEEELVLLLDGEATVNAAERTRAHLAGCPRCRRTWRALEEITSGLRAPLPAVDSPRLVAGLMLRIERGLEPRPTAPVPRRAVVAVALAVAAGIALAVAVPGARAPGGEGEGVFASRGGARLSLRQAVLVTFEREGAASLERLGSGEVVAKDARLTVSYRNVREGEPAYLLAFVVDAGHAVHWLFPAYERAGENPASIPLAPRAAESALGTSVVLDRPSSGPARLVSLVSSTPRHVADIESLPPEALSLAALRARFRDDVIDEAAVSFP